LQILRSQELLILVYSGVAKNMTFSLVLSLLEKFSMVMIYLTIRQFFPEVFVIIVAFKGLGIFIFRKIQEVLFIVGFKFILEGDINCELKHVLGHSKHETL
jgi:hypothetical protein